MKSVSLTTALWVGGLLIWGALWPVPDAFSQDEMPTTGQKETSSPDDYVGTEVCVTCHVEQGKHFALTVHAKMLQLPGWSKEKQGCESCHGPGLNHLKDRTTTSITIFKDTSPKQVSEACLQCHAGQEEHNNFRRGEHWRNDVSCINCHTVHSEESASSQSLLAKQQPELCITCHSETKAQFSLPFHHKVLEGAIQCSDCHNPHGGFELKQVRLATGVDAPCLKCHTDKQGPFVFEHAPLKLEGCTACHAPHGATNSKLLKRNTMNQLCLECHTSVGIVGAPNTPSFHNQASIRFQNCTVCHVKIHGSNDHAFYFR